MAQAVVNGESLWRWRGMEIAQEKSQSAEGLAWMTRVAGLMVSQGLVGQAFIKHFERFVIFTQVGVDHW